MMSKIILLVKKNQFFTGCIIGAPIGTFAAKIYLMRQRSKWQDRDIDRKFEALEDLEELLDSRFETNFEAKKFEAKTDDKLSNRFKF